MWIAEELVRKDWTKTSRGRAADVSALFIFERSRARARSVVTQSLPMLTRKGFKAEVEERNEQEEGKKAKVRTKAL
jgi:hypothetical protein